MSDVKETSDVSNDDAFSHLLAAAQADSDDSGDKGDKGLHQEDDGKQSEADEDKADSGAAQSNGQQQEQQEDPWSAIPEPIRNEHLNLKQNYAKLEADHRANAGRVAALNRKTQELQEQLAAREKDNGGKPVGGKDQPTAAELENMDFSEVEKEWPEVAKMVKHLVAQEQKQSQQQFEQMLTPLQQWQQEQAQLQQQAQQQQQTQQEYNRLAKTHPDYQQVIVDPAFHDWLSKQPPAVQQIAKTSNNADDASYVLTAFKSATGRTAPKQSDQQSRSDKLKDHAAIPKKGASQMARNLSSVDAETLFVQLASNR